MSGFLLWSLNLLTCIHEDIGLHIVFFALLQHVMPGQSDTAAPGQPNSL